MHRVLTLSQFRSRAKHSARHTTHIYTYRSVHWFLGACPQAASRPQRLSGFPRTRGISNLQRCARARACVYIEPARARRRCRLACLANIYACPQSVFRGPRVRVWGRGGGGGGLALARPSVLMPGVSSVLLCGPLDLRHSRRLSFALVLSLSLSLSPLLFLSLSQGAI